MGVLSSCCCCTCTVSAGDCCCNSCVGAGDCCCRFSVGVSDCCCDCCVGASDCCDCRTCCMWRCSSTSRAARPSLSACTSVRRSCSRAASSAVQHRSKHTRGCEHERGEHQTRCACLITLDHSQPPPCFISTFLTPPHHITHAQPHTLTITSSHLLFLVSCFFPLCSQCSLCCFQQCLLLSELLLLGRQEGLCA